MHAQADRSGQIFRNYRLVRMLGRGGFAEVYLGIHLRLQREAAIKILHPHLGEQDLQAFQREAQLIASLSHPHIVRVLDFDVQEHVPFLVMDYLPHGSLRHRHGKGEQVPLSTAVSYVQQVTQALDYAHSQRLIHRDVKPENMLIGLRGEIVLSDFGIAAIAHNTTSRTAQEALGTIPYMAPEQIQAQARPASDQYALGIVVYEWLAGARPFDGSFTEIFAKHLMTPPPPLGSRVPHLPPDVEHVIRKALAKDPAERFPNVLAFATALHQVSQTSAPSAITNVAVPSPTPPELLQAHPDPQFVPPAITTPPAMSAQILGIAGGDTPSLLLKTEKQQTPHTAPTTIPPGASLLPQMKSRSKRLSVRKALPSVIVALFLIANFTYVAFNIISSNTNIANKISLYQKTMKKKPTLDYTFQDEQSRKAWSVRDSGGVIIPSDESCIADTNGLKVTAINALPRNGACVLDQSLLTGTKSLLMQTTMAILDGNCGAATWGPTTLGRFLSGGLCANGTYIQWCSGPSYYHSKAIDTGLNKDNLLALLITFPESGDHVEATTDIFINGEYISSFLCDAQTESDSFFLHLELSAADLAPVSNSVLFKDVKIWKL